MRRRAVELGLRVGVAHADEGSLGARIRENRLVPFQAVIGAREAADDLVAVRLRSGQRLDPTPVAAALDRVNAAAAPSAGDKAGKTYSGIDMRYRFRYTKTGASSHGSPSDRESGAADRRA